METSSALGLGDLRSDTKKKKKKRYRIGFITRVFGA